MDEACTDASTRLPPRLKAGQGDCRRAPSTSGFHLNGTINGRAININIPAPPPAPPVPPVPPALAERQERTYAFAVGAVRM